jgi:hypothetical protein
MGFATAAGSLTAISIALVGWNGALQYPQYVWHVVSSPAFGAIPFRQLPNIVGLLAGWPVLEDAGWSVQIAALACSAGLLVLVAALRQSANNKDAFRLCFACSVIAALLAGYSTNTYDLALLIVPLAIVADRYFGNRDRRARARTLWLPTLPLLISPLWFFLWLRWERINVMAIFLVWWLFAIRREILRMRLGADPRTGPSLA